MGLLSDILSPQWTEPLSYGEFLNNIKKFKTAGTRNGDEFNKFDTPGHFYFRLMFFFWNGDNDLNESGSGGLLSPTWQLLDESTINGAKSSDAKSLEQLYNSNSAWSYLIMNNENERAELLKQFVELLSNINTRSPWYFQSIEGLDGALERKQISDDKMQFDESRKKITIKCMPDAYDNRIATLLDLYKSVVWSWQLKKEIVPANLRKFDMGLYIFSSPVGKMHGNKLYNDFVSNTLPETSDNYARIGQNQTGYITSYKYIEFHNCEIDYNSGKSGLGTLTNTDGNQQEYSIDIYFDDCYEDRYNEFMMKYIGDMIVWDAASTVTNSDGISNLIEKSKPTINADASKILEQRSDLYDGGFLENAINQLGQAGADWVKNKLTGLYLGNIFSFSTKTFIDQIKNLSSGNVIGAYNDVAKYVSNSKVKKTKNVENLGNIFKKESALNNI